MVAYKSSIQEPKTDERTSLCLGKKNQTTNVLNYITAVLNRELTTS